MKSIKDILASLDQKQRDQLEYAFEEVMSNVFIEYEPGRFVGVNIIGMPNLYIEQKLGAYASGVILQGQMPRDIIPFQA